jgi:hypothetical protein
MRAQLPQAPRISRHVACGLGHLAIITGLADAASIRIKAALRSSALPSWRRATVQWLGQGSEEKKSAFPRSGGVPRYAMHHTSAKGQQVSSHRPFNVTASALSAGTQLGSSHLALRLIDAFGIGPSHSFHAALSCLMPLAWALC